MRPKFGETRATRFWGRISVYAGAAVVFILASFPRLNAQEPEASPPAELPSEAEVEPSPIPGTEILLAPQPPSTEAPLPGQTLKLGPPAVIEPMLPAIDFERLGRSGRLWSFRG